MAADGASTGGAPVDRSATSDTLEEMEELEDGKEPIDEAIDEEDAGVPAIPTPPGVWRLGLAHDKAQALLMRFATRQDRKIKGAERLSTYYKIYGNPNYGNMVGLIRYYSLYTLPFFFVFLFLSLNSFTSYSPVSCIALLFYSECH